MKKAMIAADEWARINLYQRRIGQEQGALVPKGMQNSLSPGTGQMVQASQYCNIPLMASNIAFPSLAAHGRHILNHTA